MRRVLALGAASLIGGLIGYSLGAWVVVKAFHLDDGHGIVFGLMNDGLTAREIYRGQGRQHADRIRDGFPQRVLGIEKSFREHEARNTAFRVVREAYEASGSEIPFEIRQLLLTVPPRPIREVPPRVK
jgi:hypothetical protein